MTDINNGDKEMHASDSFMARQISQEIMEFGVNQNQLIILIQMLTMELENRELMVSINRCIEDTTKKNVGPSEVEGADLITDV